MVLCFVEFVDEKCALTAMEALQGMKNVCPYIFFPFGDEQTHRALKIHMLLLACECIITMDMLRTLISLDHTI